MNAEILSRRARHVAIGVGIVSFVATAAALLYGSTLREPSGRGRDSYSGGVAGHRALYETLTRLGYDVRRTRRGEFEAVSQPMLFIDPVKTSVRVGGERHALNEAIIARRDAGATSIVVLPKWRPISGRRGNSVLAPVALDRAKQVLEAVVPEGVGQLERPGDPSARLRSERVGGPLGELKVELPWPQTLAVTNREWAVVVGDKERTFAARNREGDVVVIADSGLAQNGMLHLGDHARFWDRLLTQGLGADRVAFDEVFHGYGREPSLGAALGGFPAVLLVIHGMSLCLLVAWVGAVRFGAPQPFQFAYGRGPREAIRVSASVLEAGCSMTTLLRRYVEHVLEDLTHRMGMPEGASMDKRAAALDALAERKGEAIRATPCLQAARRESIGPGEALEIARTAFRLSYLLRESAASRESRAFIERGA